MRSYRIFLVDAKWHVQEERHFKARDDLEAKRLADEIRGDRAAELWSLHHRLGRWAGSKTTAKPKRQSGA